ncbi:hypothetical protein HX030_02265 [Myroides odoratimimus]|uniref:hypothetical protein n=1 Tax=Myroides odoratimimus TaxID=76832 RepID=UPI0025762BE9|nr:hypothetical protein [Myroides odoratimimus]MDM1448902.1 hypothetical protein [Myroides odoratimimus]MDM1465888.1 hypothetical protein [Myroides odoratimimus]MDM1468993.1 hypothetical protein [Myroides odoratimimus]MDM1479005.1 hypothetical protein [Myroides odoratimimus]
MQENSLDKNIDIFEVGAVLADFYLASKNIPAVTSAIMLSYRNLISPVSKREKLWIPKVIEICKSIQNRGMWISEDKEDELVSYLLVLNQNVMKTHQDEKISMFEKLLQGYFLNQEVDYDISITYLNLTDRLTIKHIQLLRNIKNCSIEELIGDLSYNTLYNVLKIKELSLDLGQFRFILDELVTLGLIFKSENIIGETRVKKESGILLENQPYENLPVIVLSDFAFDYMNYLYGKM